MKLKAALTSIILTLISIITAHAQGLPCGGTDPDATCPLDSWVIILIVASCGFAAFTLLRNRKATGSSAS